MTPTELMQAYNANAYSFNAKDKKQFDDLVNAIGCKFLKSTDQAFVVTTLLAFVINQEVKPAPVVEVAPAPVAVEVPEAVEAVIAVQQKE